MPWWRWRQRSKREWILGILRREAADLAHDLKEFIRKHDHRYQQEPFGREADVVRRAMEFLIGWESAIPEGKSESAVTRAKE